MKKYGKRSKRPAARRRPRRRFGRKRKAGLRPRTTVLRGPPGCPDSMFLKFTYQDVGNTAVTHGTNQVVDFSGNCCAEPVVGDTSKLCSFFNQWSVFYETATVYSSKIEVTVIDTTSTVNSCGYFLAVVPLDGGSTPVTLAQAMLQPRAKYRFIQAGSGRMRPIRHFMSTACLLGMPKMQITADEDFSHLMTIGAQPTRQWIWNVFLCPADQVNTDVTGVLSVKLTYYVKLTDRRMIPLS